MGCKLPIRPPSSAQQTDLTHSCRVAHMPSANVHRHEDMLSSVSGHTMDLLVKYVPRMTSAHDSIADFQLQTTSFSARLLPASTLLAWLCYCSC